MSCQTCDHTMQNIGCCITTGIPFFWCPRCGTLKPCDGDAATPALVSFCRDFEHTIKGVCAEHSHLWNKNGIRDAINVPGRKAVLS